MYRNGLFLVPSTEKYLEILVPKWLASGTELKAAHLQSARTQTTHTLAHTSTQSE